MEQRRSGSPVAMKWWLIACVLGCALLFAGPAAAQTPTPEPARTGFAGGSDEATGYVGHEDEVFRILNDYWDGVFAEAGLTYMPPEVVQVTTSMSGPCGQMRPDDDN